jgi:dihydrofolate reductase
MLACIWAQTSTGIIGLNGKIPWHYAGDFRRFKRLTAGSTVVMGRRTYESIGKPLPNRKNIVITSLASWQQSEELRDAVPSKFDGTTLYSSIRDMVMALASAGETGDIWFIGGRKIYAVANLYYVDLIDVTYVPDEVTVPAGADVVYAPKIDETIFAPGELLQHEDEPSLKRRVYLRRTLAEAPYDDASNRRLQELGYLTRRQP